MATAADFATALTQVLRYEGGFVQDPDDPGGATNRGVTQGTYDSWRRRQGLPVRPVREIGNEEVSAIYREDYWFKSGADKLPMPLALVHFDTAVNMGVGAANALLAGAKGDTAAYLDLRRERYQKIIQARPTSAKFLKGWLARVESLARTAGQSPGATVGVAGLLVLAYLAVRYLYGGR